MIIELLGIPGCGKSTYAEKYIKKNNAINPLNIHLYRESRIKQNLNKIKLMICFIFIKPANFFSIYKCFDSIKFTSYVKKLKMMLYLFSILGVVTLIKIKYINSTIILDEGVNQVLWGISYNSIDSDEKIFILQRKLKDFMGDAVFIMDVEIETIKSRLKKRKNKGGDELKSDLEKDSYCIIRSIEILDRIKYQVKKVNPEGKVKVIRWGEDEKSSLFNK